LIKAQSLLRRFSFFFFSILGVLVALAQASAAVCSRGRRFLSLAGRFVSLLIRVHLPYPPWRICAAPTELYRNDVAATASPNWTTSAEVEQPVDPTQGLKRDADPSYGLDHHWCTPPKVNFIKPQPPAGFQKNRSTRARGGPQFFKRPNNKNNTKQTKTGRAGLHPILPTPRPPLCRFGNEDYERSQIDTKQSANPRPARPP